MVRYTIAHDEQGSPQAQRGDHAPHVPVVVVQLAPPLDGILDTLGTTAGPGAIVALVGFLHSGLQPWLETLTEEHAAHACGARAWNAQELEAGRNYTLSVPASMPQMHASQSTKHDNKAAFR